MNHLYKLSALNTKSPRQRSTRVRAAPFVSEREFGLRKDEKSRSNVTTGE